MYRAMSFARVLMVAFLFAFAAASPSFAQSDAFKQALAATIAKDKDAVKFYKSRAYKPIWMGRNATDRKRRDALVIAFKNAGAHGLPTADYDGARLAANIQAASGAKARGQLEGIMTLSFMRYARDVQTGVLTPSRVDSEIARKVPYRGRLGTLIAFTKSTPSAFLKALPPKSVQYARLMKEKIRLEKMLGRGGWGPTVRAKSLKPGQAGDSVVALRNRLVAMGFMRRTNSTAYDQNMVNAVKQFQSAHGLSADGVAGPGTLKQVNQSMETRLASVVVAMERERWINRPLGKRHVWVNLTDFSATIVDGNRVTFQTRSVIGATDKDRRSPEFSDVMEFMVINPSWYVPRSITTKEYLPLLQKNRNAVSHLEIRDSKGRTVNRSNIDFNKFDEKTFPYSMRQPPSRGNALGLVKFMFPNKYNIYLHDTPAKKLFSREVRAFSHGCIRLNDPFDFAYALLAKQSNDPVGFFQAKLKTGKEARVNLREPVPVHIVYRTAFVNAGGRLNFRRDIYGRDAKIWNALKREGVALRAVQG